MNNDRRQNIEDQMVEQYYGMKTHIRDVEGYLSSYGQVHPEYAGPVWSVDEQKRGNPTPRRVDLPAEECGCAYV
ncbi:hypothetical protein LCGC14_0264690 [marine sediment metagenome]|uniref:Uncharacterized protein n=1 Tax=marine sediment metagenome TaxID=412755 RepID=A0A0F9WLJ4_9ZZZZ